MKGGDFMIKVEVTEQFNLQDFSKIKNLKRCKKCGNITNNEICDICASRNNDKI